jgi:hypothetical protein
MVAIETVARMVGCNCNVFFGDKNGVVIATVARVVDAIGAVLCRRQKYGCHSNRC